MASGPLDRSSPLDQSKVLQEELTCPVCLDVFHDPRLLPCGHNFCKICLDRLRQLTDQSRFQCPECRESHRCNRSFQKNFKLANIAFDFRRRRRAANSSTGAEASALASKVCVASISTGQRECVPCDYCPPPTAELSGPGTSADAGNSQDKGDMQAGSAGDSNMAVKMCLKCEVSMCPEHVKPHLELPAFREHPLTEPMKDFWKRKCPDHDEIFKYYCLQDEVCVCNACTVEGRHTGHTIKTLRNTMIDIKQVRLHKQLNKMERKYTLAQKMLHEQSMKESANKKFLEDSDACLTRLRQDLEAKVAVFVNRLLECARTNCEAVMPTIQKNITRINQDLTRLWEVHSGIKSLMEERDAFRFIEAYKTTGKQCRKLLKKNMFDPDYVDIDPGLLAIMMEDEMQKFLNLDLTFYIFAAIKSICQQSDNEEERYESEDVIREETEDAEPDEGSDHDDGSEEELSEDEEESEEEVEEGQENEGHELSDSDALYISEQEEEEEEEDEEEGQENESHELSDSDALYIPEEEEEEEESEERDEGGEEAQDEEYEDIEDGEEGRDEGGEEAQDEDYEDIEDGEEGD
ncbi:E3 ubiquitin/ISG15 ligase TRIM25 isoform X1 [Syngnathus acus]|uniref:E3 ubiquitin/ISG15 ligase TRIM25 isoform X1 n=1 Tax=Syngnathus acus TaxID=161584 RepID=UPI001885E7F1|nr:E3 ubiquitin/ISG15 ligase TRIM25 isoform X1 [Syngnathus acus]XP_037118576.1 E3 ubiquitin/ISG15 ligase TRIM25 isoform X1 [Syngnathus acus]XP_037118578.1 E3 ubiquitin/ISG15 ligase TRIM25 isoform X1 [Syngnathus acus]XP_037118579.1 E3 ubiquitin/ISG15 ligase TRIM25 isoform X1 [Syngnathus acus]